MAVQQILIILLNYRDKFHFIVFENLQKLELIFLFLYIQTLFFEKKYSYSQYT